MARRTTTTTKQRKDHTGVGWLALGIVMTVVFALFALLGEHPTESGTLSALWFGVIIGMVMVIFGVIGMTKRRHPGHI